MTTRPFRHRMAGALGIGLLLCASAPALAADGVTEINWVRVRDGGITGSDAGGVPVTIDTSGTYRLTGDISSSIGAVGVIIADPENSTVIEVVADDVTIDLNGFTISGPGLSGTGDGVRSTAANTVVRNGTIDGVGQDGVSLGDGARVHDLVVAGSGRDGIATGASSLVLDSVVRDNGAFGLHLGSHSGFGGNSITLNNGGNDQPQVKAALQDIHEVATNQCGWDSSCPGVADKLVFVSSLVDGNLGGLAGADATCNADAGGQGFTGSFMAWVSDGVTDPDARFSKADARYVLPSGTVVAGSYADLTDGNIAAPIDETAAGGAAPGTTWTDVNELGFTHTGLDNCVGWTSNNVANMGWRGQTSQTDFRWSNGLGSASCNQTKGLYCFEQ